MKVKQARSIYNPRTRFLVVDIETPKNPNSIICDIAFGIWSREEGKLGSAGYLIEEYRGYSTYYPKETLYQEYETIGLYHTRPFAKVMEIMDRIIDKYNPTFATAYNSNFDFPRIKDECERQGIFCPLDRLIEFDLWRAACETIGQQKTFKKWIDDNKILTEKGNRQSGAEAMYRYMKLNPHFEEEHTGLADIEIEMAILGKVQRQKKKMSMAIGGNCWRLVQG
jgi:DNA polymerase elongation subunit (family B)